MPKIAISTQTYRHDIDECALLCESISRFVLDSIDHFIFVNDEDYELFAADPRFARAKIHRKSELLPKTFFKLPFRLMGHKCYVSPATIPVRQWIVQQICKLAVFDVIGDSYDAVMHLDSECVFMRPFSLDSIYRDGRFMLYSRDFEEEPYHEKYCRAAKKALRLDADVETMAKRTYMTQPMVFERRSLQEMLARLGKGSLFGWKYRFANNYKISEIYLYSLYCIHVLDGRGHFNTDKRRFPLIHVVDFDAATPLEERARMLLSDPDVTGICFQKGKRRDGKCVDSATIASVVRKIWED